MAEEQIYERGVALTWGSWGDES